MPRRQMPVSSAAPPDTGRRSGAVAVVGRVLPGPVLPCASTIRRRDRPTPLASSLAFPRERDRRLPAAPTRTPRLRTFPRERPAVPPAPPRPRAARLDTGRQPSPGQARRPKPPPPPSRWRPPVAARTAAPPRRPTRQLKLSSACINHCNPPYCNGLRCPPAADRRSDRGFSRPGRERAACGQRDRQKGDPRGMPDSHLLAPKKLSSPKCRAGKKNALARFGFSKRHGALRLAGSGDARP